MERNKHLLLADKYGWDTEPLASDSEVEKRIKRAIKESKSLRNEKKARSSSSTKRAELICDRLSGTSYIRMIQWHIHFSSLLNNVFIAGVPPFELQALQVRCE
jgi:hypothetical protein